MSSIALARPPEIGFIARMRFHCPECNQPLTCRDDLVGGTVRCPACKKRVRVPEPDEDSSETVAPRRADGEPREVMIEIADTSTASHASVPFWQSALIGTGIAVVFYVCLLPLAGRDIRLIDLFTARGWVPIALVWMMAVCIAILFLKSRALKQERLAMNRDALPVDIAAEINENNVADFIDHVNHQPEEFRNSYILSRIRRGLEHFYTRRSNPEVANMLASQSDIDATEIQSSYELVKVFIWAIPILGFIGTVLGISDAISGIEFSNDVKAMEASVARMLSGLGIAFDTTLIALVMSILVSIPANAMQKGEEELLNRIDEYCNENLLKRLDDGGGVSDVADNTQLILNALGSAVAESQHDLLQEMKEVQSELARTQREHLELFADVNKTVGEQVKALEERVDQTLGDVVSSVREEGQVAMQAAAESLAANFDALERGIGALNRVLEKLGEQQVVIQQVEAPRRGLFGRKKLF